MTSAWDTAGILPIQPPDDLDDHDVVVTDKGRTGNAGSLSGICTPLVSRRTTVLSA
jgi:hypothetical protein